MNNFDKNQILQNIIQKTNESAKELNDEDKNQNISEELQLISEIPIRHFTPNEVVSLGAIVELKFNNLVNFYFLTSTGAGLIIKINGKTILVLSIFSSLGNVLLEKKVGDHFEIEVNGKQRRYEIINIY